MKTRFLGTWVGIFGALFLLSAAGLQFWALTDADLRERLIAYTAILAVSGSTLGTLGMACWRVARLEDRVAELERLREPAGTPAPTGGSR